MYRESNQGRQIGSCNCHKERLYTKVNQGQQRYYRRNKIVVVAATETEAIVVHSRSFKGAVGGERDFTHPPPVFRGSILVSKSLSPEVGVGVGNHVMGCVREALLIVGSFI